MEKVTKLRERVSYGGYILCGREMHCQMRSECARLTMIVRSDGAKVALIAFRSLESWVCDGRDPVYARSRKVIRKP